VEHQGHLWAGANLPQRLKLEVTREHPTGPDVVVVEAFSFGTKTHGPLWSTGQKFEGAHADLVAVAASEAIVARWLGGGWRDAPALQRQEAWEQHLLRF
jgi:hypothetical protein